MVRYLASVALLLQLTTACGNASTPNTEIAPSSPTTVSDPVDEIRPPELMVTAGSEELALAPFAWCWTESDQSICADGVPPEPLPSLTLAPNSELSFHFPIDWHLQASLFPGEDFCEVSEVDVLIDGTPVVSLGPAGTYRVEVFGSGEGGDGAWSFELVTTEDRPRPPLFVHTSWHPGSGDLDPEAPFLAGLGNLTERPDEVMAHATVSASNGTVEDFDMSARIDEDCSESSIALEAPNDFSRRVVDLGPPPYEVSLTFIIDGQAMAAEILTWPDDYPTHSNESRADVEASP